MSMFSTKSAFGVNSGCGCKHLSLISVIGRRRMTRCKAAGALVGFLVFVAVNISLFHRWSDVQTVGPLNQRDKDRDAETGTTHQVAKLSTQPGENRARDETLDNNAMVKEMGVLERALKRSQVSFNDDGSYYIEEEQLQPQLPNSHIMQGEHLGDFMKFITDADDADLQDPLVHKHEFRFTLNNEHACNGDVFLLVVVHSAAGKQSERAEIRRTWGDIRFFYGAVIVPLFMLAMPSNDAEITQAALVKESKIYRDIIQGDFIDSYRNLTYKHVMLLHWVQNYCKSAKFILKLDDDVMVDMFHLVNFLFQKSPDGVIQNFLYCSTYRNQGPVRRTDDNWFVTEKEYPYTKYPPYCEGFAYVMSFDVSKALYQATARVPFYWVDDVYVTGFLAARAGVTHRDMENGHGYDMLESKDLHKHVKTSIFLLAKYENLRKNWDQAWQDILTLNRNTENKL